MGVYFMQLPTTLNLVFSLLAFGETCKSKQLLISQQPNYILNEIWTGY